MWIEPEVHIEDDDRDNNWEDDEDHGEEKILADQRDDDWCGRNDFGQQQKEHRKGQQDGDAEGNLLQGK